MEITQEKVLKHWWAIATADANELTKHRRVNCRHCWGEGHAYQWTEVEHEIACREASKDGASEEDIAIALGQKTIAMARHYSQEASHRTRMTAATIAFDLIKRNKAGA